MKREDYILFLTSMLTINFGRQPLKTRLFLPHREIMEKSGVDGLHNKTYNAVDMFKQVVTAGNPGYHISYRQSERLSFSVWKQEFSLH